MTPENLERLHETLKRFGKIMADEWAKNEAQTNILNVSVDSSSRTLGRRGLRLDSFHSHHASHCRLKVGMTHLRAFCAVS
jgi:hypothetical protein